jgi:hypothetical protein
MNMKLEYIDIVYGEARKNSPVTPKAIGTNINLTKAELDGSNLRVQFDFLATYSPDGSHLRLSGVAVFSGQEAKKAFDEWSKTARITGEPGEYILNSINYSASINAIQMSRVFNLTPPVTLPRLTMKPPPKEKKR